MNASTKELVNDIRTHWLTKPDDFKPSLFNPCWASGIQVFEPRAKEPAAVLNNVEELEGWLLDNKREVRIIERLFTNAWTVRLLKKEVA